MFHNTLHFAQARVLFQEASEWKGKAKPEALHPQCLKDWKLLTRLLVEDRSWVVATQIFFIFTPKIGEDEPILTNIFQRG